MRRTRVTALVLMPFLIVLVEIVSETSIAAALSDSVVATIPAGLSPRMLAYDPSRSWLYVPNVGDNTVSIIVGTTPIYTISDPSFNFPSGATYANGYVYVTNHGPQTNDASQCGNTVSVIKDTRVIDTINVGNCPSSVAFNPINEIIYVVNSLSDNVSVIDSSTNEVIANVDVGPAFPVYIEYNPLDGMMYVPVHNSGNCPNPPTCVASPFIAVINGSHQVDRRIEIGLQVTDRLPNAIAFNPINEKMYVILNQDRITPPDTPPRIILIDGNPSRPSTYGTVTGDIQSSQFGPDMQGIAFNHNNGLMYVGNSPNVNFGIVAVIDNTNIVHLVVLGSGGPWGIASAPQGMYVANQLSNTVSLIAPCTCPAP